MTDTEGAPFVFVSYSRANRDTVDRLIGDLRRQGIDIWIDRQGLRVGTPSWEQALRDAIRAAQVVLLVASPDARISPYVADELRIAMMYQRMVYPFWVAGDEWMECVPIGWGGTQHIDGRGAHYQAALHELVATLQRGQAGPPSLPHPAQVASKPEVPPRNPYKGLRAFSAADAGDFFGRESLVDTLVDAVRAPSPPRFLAVVGPSGSGKSSVVLAGLLPRLRAGALPGSASWVYLDPLVPGAHPLEALSVALGNALPNSPMAAIRGDLDHSPRGLHLLAGRLVKESQARVVLVVDQAEELFTLTSEHDERRRFIDLLVTAATEPRGSLALILTLRADFYDRPMSYPALGALMESWSKSVLPMSTTDLREAVERPAALPDVGLRFEGDLVGDLLFEVRGQAGALPLLQFTLDQLFERRQGRNLMVAAYRELGGVRGSLAHHAEATYAALSSEGHRRLARALFGRLIDPGATEQDTTRRRAAMAELELPDAEQTAVMRAVVDAFITARLLTAGEQAGLITVEVSHEALIREWARLAGWLHEARDDIRMQGAISADAMQWVRHDRPPDRVYRGTLLDEAQAWAERNTPSAAERDFLTAGLAERARQQAAERDQQTRELALARQAAVANQRAANRLRYLAGVLLLFLAGTAALAVFAIKQADSANTNARNAANARAAAVTAHTLSLSRQLAAQALTHLDDAPDLALLLSVAANQVSSTVEARDSLLRALEHDPRLIVFLRGHQGPVLSVAFSPDGKTLASGGKDTTVRLWDIAGRRPLGQPLTGHTGTVNSVAFSRDGRTLASASSDGTVRLWTMGSRKPTGAVIPDEPASVTNLAFSPAAALLAYGGDDAAIRLWDVARGRPVGQPLTDHLSYPRSVAFSPDGTLLAVGASDGATRLWDVRRGATLGSRLVGHTDAVTTVVFSPSGAILATGSADSTIRLWNVMTMRLMARLTGHTAAVTSLAFSPDGTILASGSADMTVRLWDAASGQPLGAPFPSRTGTVNSIAFSPDGKTLAAGNADGAVWLWAVARTPSLGLPLIGHTDTVNSVAFSHDGRTLVSGSSDTTLRLWDVARKQPLGRPLTGSLSGVYSVAFSPVSDLIASGGADLMVRLWDTARGRPITALIGHAADVISVAFSRDGRTLASSGGGDGTVRLWDVARKQPLGRPLFVNSGVAGAVALSPDGRLLAAGDGDGSIQIWGVASRRPLDLPFAGHTASVDSVVFSPDGTVLASGSADTTVRLWSVATGKQIFRPLRGHTDIVRSVAFSPDGTMLASGSADGTVRLWDVASGLPIGLPLTGHTGGVTSVAFSPDGTMLVSASADTTIGLWDTGPVTWTQHACREANRDLTALEWKQYLGEEPRHAVCSLSS